jgi:hypothetical protein
MGEKSEKRYLRSSSRDEIQPALQYLGNLLVTSAAQVVFFTLFINSDL